MNKQFKLNYPVETEEAQSFWASKHRLNRIKAIIAFSLNIDNANDNLRRAGYSRQYRKRYLETYKCYVNSPSMKIIPFSDLHDLWFEPQPCTQAVAIISDSSVGVLGEWKTDRSQTLSLSNGEVFTGHADRLKEDGTPNGSMGYGSTLTGGDPSIATATVSGRDITISAIQAGKTIYTLTSGDRTSKTTIIIEVTQ